MWLVVAMLGCAGNTGPGFMGIEVFDHFPLDGGRWWDYAQDDAAVTDRWRVEKNSIIQEKGDTDVITLAYGVKDMKTDTIGTLLYEVDWSSDSTDGVMIHGYTPQSGGPVSFDPPITFGNPYMEEGESVNTTTGGHDFVGTFEESVSCTNHWVQDAPWECLQMKLTSDGGDFPFVGTYWIAPRYAVSSFTPAGFETAWVLTEAHWEPAEDTTE